MAAHQPGRHRQPAAGRGIVTRQTAGSRQEAAAQEAAAQGTAGPDASRSLAGVLAPRLALLRALAAEGNVTRAAELMGVPQPTISRWLAALADDLGAPVVVRDGRGIRLSRAGEYLAAAADRALSVLEGGCRQAIEEVDPDRGQVVLAFLHTMGESRVPKLLRAFRREHQRVRFTLLQGAQEDVLGQVRTGSADLALTSPPPAGGEFEHASLDKQPLVATLPAGHRLASRPRVRLAQLAGDPFVGMKQIHGLRLITDDLCRTAGFTPELAFEGEEVDTVRGLVAAGLGVAILPVAEQALPPGVVEVPLAPAASREIVLVWAAGRPLAPAARAFREFALWRRARR
jgi:LysR family transcriptional regulator, transcription activator of glutamate synthase operon